MSHRGKMLIVCLGLIVIAMARAFEPGQLPPPDDVLRNSDLARERMLRLRNAVYSYMNEQGKAPSDPAELFPRYISDPLTFWHPGDSDPPPTTIDNSVPDAPNSTRISFDWGSLNYNYPACETPRLRDNSPSNNGGLFVNLLYDGPFETDPPLATPTPTAVYMAQARLQGIAWAMRIYTNDNNEYLPINILRLWDGCRTENFWNPGDREPAPETFTNSEPDRPNSIQGSFLYYGMGYRIGEITPNQIMMRDASSTNNRRVGYNVLWGDWRVTFEVEGKRGDENRNGQLDVTDWIKMLECLDGPQTPILDIRCRYFDWNSDDRVDLYDSALFARTINQE